VSEERQRFGRYELIERVAVGGMAELHRAVITGPSGFTKTVAIKKILPDLNRHSRFREMFLHEGRIMGQLSHRNLVQVFELGEEQGELYLCFEYVPGCNLAQVLARLAKRRERMDPALATWIVREVCQALDYVHGVVDERGRGLDIVHRDVNPQNILLSRQGDVKLGDFGIARSIVTDMRTQRGHIKGKLQYLAPEQARGDALGPASDLYALGIVLFELLTLQNYLRGNNDVELLKRAAQPAWRSISAVREDVPPTLERAVERALRPEPEQRFASAAALAQALTGYLQRCERQPDATDVSALVEAVCGRELRDELKTIKVATRADIPGAADVLLSSPDVPVKAPSLGAATHTLSIPALRLSDVRRGHRRRGTVAALAAAVVIGGGLLVWGALRAPARGGDGAPLEDVAGVAQGVADASVTDTGGEDAAITVLEQDLSDIVLDAGSASGADRSPAKRPGGRRWGKRPKRHPKPAPRVVEEPPPPDLSALKAELKRQRGRLRVRGIRSNDSIEVDRLLDQARRALGKRQAEEVEQALRELDRTLDALVIDRAFVERKIKRLQRALARAGKEQEFETRRREILGHAINNRYSEANAAINRAFDALGSR